MSLKKVEVYQTEDGAIHKTKFDAAKHELDLYLMGYQEGHGITINSIGEAMEAICHQPARVMRILKNLT